LEQIVKTRLFIFSFLPVIGLLAPVEAKEGENRPRLRELGLEVGVLKPGLLNAITDVAGVKVGQVTIIGNAHIRTGVTAVIPHDGNLFQEKVPAAIVVGNGFGKLIGPTQVNELGELETPIVLTNTLSVWDAARATVEYTLAQPGNESVRSVNPVVGETNDGFLNDIRGFHVKKEHVLEALQRATSGPVAEGSVGAGTGTVCFGWKGGIGTSSRLLPENLGKYTVGVLVQTNFGGILQMAGVQLGKELGKYYLRDESRYGASDSSEDSGSCMIVVALDAPVDARQLQRIARRALFALGITGSSMSHGSGDYVIAFSTTRTAGSTKDSLRLELSTRLRDEDLSPIFQAVVEATEEAIYNSLLKATTLSGVDGHTVEALPIDRVKEILRKYGRMK
jgi:D-aminopeptidase